jgi:hypothetical protein
VNYAVGLGCAFAQACQIFDGSAVCACASGGQRSGGGVRPRQAGDLMASSHQFLNHGGTDEAGGTCYEYSHGVISSNGICRSGADSVPEVSRFRNHS